MQANMLGNRRIGLRLTPANAPYIFLLPFLFFFLTFRVGPILWSLFFCFMQWDGFAPPRPVGFGNFLNILDSERFWKSVSNTFYLIVVYNLIMLSLAIALAVLVSEKTTKWKRFFRTMYFLPVATSLTVCAIVFDRVLATKYGFVNIAIQNLGGTGTLPFLSSADWINNSIIMMKIWRGTWWRDS
jgi:ABC-type sugar transport system permease subunit